MTPVVVVRMPSQPYPSARRSLLIHGSRESGQPCFEWAAAVPRRGDRTDGRLSVTLRTRKGLLNRYQQCVPRVPRLE